MVEVAEVDCRVLSASVRSATWFARVRRAFWVVERSVRRLERRSLGVGSGSLEVGLLFGRLAVGGCGVVAGAFAARVAVRSASLVSALC